MNQQITKMTGRNGWHFQTRRAQAKQRTYEQLVDAARRLFDEKGYEATTIRDVAEAVGMSTGAVFSNFLDKAALFVDVINTDCERLNLRMAQTDLSGCSVALALERLLAVAHDHYADQLGLLQAMVSFIWRSDLSPDRRTLHGLNAIKAHLAGALSRGVETGALKPNTNVQLMTEMLINSYIANYRRRIAGDLVSSEFLALQRQQIDILLAGCVAA